jgi:enterobactin synthetase component F
MGEAECSARLRDVADQTPHAVAIADADVFMTYTELDACVDATVDAILAHTRGGAGVVAIRTGSVHALAVASFAVPRAGCTAVPIDPSYPEERVRTILRDVDALLVLTDVDGGELLGVPTLKPVRSATERHRRWRPAATPASIIFTSGSTGVPKGITIDRDDFTLEWIAERGQLGPRDRAVLMATGSGPASLLLPRCTAHIGGRLMSYDIRSRGLTPLPEWLVDNEITLFGTVPTLTRFLDGTFTNGRAAPAVTTVVSYGEGMRWDDVATLRRVFPNATVYNSYGTTESGSVAALAVAPEDPMGEGVLPVGRAMTGVALQVVGPDGTPCPPGAEGELVVDTMSGGTSYWRRPELTQRVWTSLPDGRRRVRTGDRAVLDGDGVLTVLGRLDHVVKVSGNRIELGEVEAALRDLDGVHDAVAGAFPDEHGDLRLRAAVTAERGVHLHPQVLRAGLARRVPAFMVPATVSVRTELQRLPNGKADRRALESTKDSPHQDRALGPGLESQLAALFGQVLGTRGVGPDDSFFDLGGDSMRAARLFTEIERELGIDQPPTLLVEAPTVAALATVLAKRGPREVLVPVRVLGTRPPLFAIHGGLGDLLFLRGLAEELGEDQPVYGLVAPALDGLWPQEKSLTDLAARYLRAVRRVQPVGPFQLFGYSLGGIIAHEMAVQLEAGGDEVALLALGGTTISEKWGPIPDAVARVRQLDVVRQASWSSLPHEVGVLAVNQVRHRRDLRRARADAAAWPRHLEGSRQGNPVPVELRGQFVMHTYGALARSHSMTRLERAPTVLLRSNEPGPADLGWSSWVGDLTTVTLDTDHDAMVRRDVVLTAAALGAHLRGAG